MSTHFEGPRNKSFWIRGEAIGDSLAPHGSMMGAQDAER
jgi:hypothetical protein